MSVPAPTWRHEQIARPPLDTFATYFGLTFAFDHLEERFVLRRVVLDAEPLLRQLCQQIGDGFAFMELHVPGAARRAIPPIFVSRRLNTGIIRAVYLKARAILLAWC